VRTRKTIVGDTNFTNRRQALRAIGAALAGGSVGAALGCSAEAMPTSPSTASTSGGTGSTSCVEAASETRGPYPDTTGMIGNQAFYRQDIREGRPGVALTLVLTIVNVRNGCAPVSGAAVEIWQCDADGHYSEYAQPGYNGTGQTFLRGLQTSNAGGQVTFITVYPGWYQGRATHIHVDVNVGGARVKSTQIAFPEGVTREVYASGVYASSGQNPTTNASDNVFSDGTSTEMAALSGSVGSGYTATLTIGVSA
jgi:protocatechuate 3,4-dioxygenase beta subunit